MAGIIQQWHTLSDASNITKASSSLHVSPRQLLDFWFGEGAWGDPAAMSQVRLARWLMSYRCQPRSCASSQSVPHA